jgi:hypothetical protein
MWRRISFLIGMAVVAGYALWTFLVAEGESIRLGGAYHGLFGHALMAYVRAHPEAPARAGYRTKDGPPRPCDPLQKRGPMDSCQPLSVRVDKTPLWLLPIVPKRVTVRIRPEIWADAEARGLLLKLARNKGAACDAVDEGEPTDIPYERYGLGCDERQPPPHQIWFSITSASSGVCTRLSSGEQTCHPLRVDDSHAFRVN